MNKKTLVTPNHVSPPLQLTAIAINVQNTFHKNGQADNCTLENIFRIFLMFQ